MRVLMAAAAAAAFVVAISAAHPADLSPTAVLDVRAKADKAATSGDWATAAKSYETFVAANPYDGLAWLRYARAQSRTGDCSDAEKSYEHGLDLGARDRAFGLYGLAQMRVQCGNMKGALTALRDSLAAGYPNRMEIAGDDVFKPLSSNAQFHAIIDPPAAPTDRARGWLSDLDYLTSEIRRVHYVYRTTPLPPAFLNAADEFRTRIATMSDAEAILALQKMMASLGNGHSLIYPAGMKQGALHVLPLRWYWFKDGLYVLNSGVQADMLVGRRVVKIGNLSASDALARAKAYISRDNDEELYWVGPAYLKVVELLRAIGATSGDSVSLVVEDKGAAKTITVSAKVEPAGLEDYDITLPPLSGKPNPSSLADTEKNFWFEPRADGIVYAQFNRVLNAEDETLESFADRLKSALSAPSVKGLVLDLRRNNGGNASLIVPLLRTLVWFEATRGKGSLVTLIGRNTFSAAQNFTSYLDMMSDTVFVGEPTSSRPIHIGDEAMFQLSYSGALGTIAAYIHHDAISRDARVWIAPNVPVGLSYADYAAGRDPAFDAAIAIVTRKP